MTLIAASSSCIYRMGCFPLILVHYVLPASIAWAVFLLSWCIMFFLHLSHALFSSYLGALCSSCIYRMGCFPLILVHYVLPASIACAVFLLSRCIMFFPASIAWVVFLLSWCIMFFLHLSHGMFSSYPGALSCSSCIRIRIRIRIPFI